VTLEDRIWEAYYEKWLGPRQPGEPMAWLLDSSFSGIRLTPLPWWLETACPSPKQLKDGTCKRGRPYRPGCWRSGNFYSACYARELYNKQEISPQDLERVWEFVGHCLGTSWDEAAARFQCRALFLMNDADPKKQNFFCSELVATVLQLMGVLHPGFPAANVLPKDFAESFASMNDSTSAMFLPCCVKHRLPMLGDCHFGPLVDVDLEYLQDEHEFTSQAGMTKRIEMYQKVLLGQLKETLLDTPEACLNWDSNGEKEPNGTQTVNVTLEV